MLINITKSSGKLFYNILASQFVYARTCQDHHRKLSNGSWNYINFESEKYHQPEKMKLFEMFRKHQDLKRSPSKRCPFESFLLESKDVPLTVLQSFLKESGFGSKGVVRNKVLRLRGPGESAFVVQITSSDIYSVQRFVKNFLMKKYKCRFDEGFVKDLFVKTAVIDAKPGRHMQNASSTVHASTSGADGVYVRRGNVQFLCNIRKYELIKRRLTKAGYQVLSTSVGFLPKSTINLKRQDKIVCANFLRDLQCLPQVRLISHNIALPDARVETASSVMSKFKSKTKKYSS